MEHEDEEGIEQDGQSEGVNLLVNNEDGNAELPTEEADQQQYEDEEDEEPIQNKLTPEQIIQLQNLQQSGQATDEQIYELQMQMAAENAEQFSPEELQQIQQQQMNQLMYQQ